MVFCVVEDLMFVSKLKTAAAALGVELRFVRSRDALLEQARLTSPTLLVVDLNADRLRPLDMVAAVRSEATLASTRTVGFVSHVQADRIEAARAAGVDSVLARSAFVAQLPSILTGGA